jgi:hypothetical protein
LVSRCWLTGDAGNKKPALMAGFFVSGVWWNYLLPSGQLRLS